ncbi:MAG: uroporphyrinogen decarboxylase family protein [Candidatus Poribacteria bacterium]
MATDNRTPGQKFRDTLLIRGTGEVPIWGGCSLATWIRYGDDLLDVLEKHPDVPFGRLPRGSDALQWVGPANRANEECLDNWGCLWHCVRDGMEGQIKYHPLSDIRHLRHYKAPDPLIYTERGVHDWGAFVRHCQNARVGGGVVTIGGERFYERVHFLRGMAEALEDMAFGTPEIEEIVELILEYNMTYLRHALQLGSPVDVVGFGDDWGAQDRCMISPATFRRFFKPGYTKMYALCKQYGALTTQHSDGYTVDLWDEFLEAGLTAFNMQVNCVGVDVIENRLKGRMCIIADVDRQSVVPFGKPEEAYNHIAEIVTRLGSPRGGLILRVDIYPDVPLENIDAVLSAISDYQNHWVNH